MCERWMNGFSNDTWPAASIMSLRAWVAGVTLKAGAAETMQDGYRTAH
jgi:hypothetical protein